MEAADIQRAFGWSHSLSSARTGADDSFPIHIPHLPTQELRQRYFCFYHKRQCIKIFLVITHEDLCCYVSPEAPGSCNDKTFLHLCMQRFEHSVDDLLWADTAYSSTPHVVCKFEKPMTNQERHFNDIAGIARTRVERYFAFIHNNFKIFQLNDDWRRGSRSLTAQMMTFVCDLRNFHVVSQSPSTFRVPKGEPCQCGWQSLNQEQMKDRAKQLAKSRIERAKRAREESSS